MKTPKTTVFLLFAALFVACAPAEEGQSVEEVEAAALAAQIDSVEQALALLTPESFDSITWESEEAAHERGLVVFNFSCAKCHGAEGTGDAGMVQKGDTLVPPTFLTADWRFGNDHENLRRHIFAGTVNGMPHWGLHGLKLRDVDAVARFINGRLRRDVN